MQKGEYRLNIQHGLDDDGFEVRLKVGSDKSIQGRITACPRYPSLVDKQVLLSTLEIDHAPQFVGKKGGINGFLRTIEQMA